MRMPLGPYKNDTGQSLVTTLQQVSCININKTGNHQHYRLKMPSHIRIHYGKIMVKTGENGNMTTLSNDMQQVVVNIIINYSMKSTRMSFCIFQTVNEFFGRR